MKLHELTPAPGSRRKPKRLGRGPGSGWGKTAGRGSNGQKSRSGYSRKTGFEGGQMPLNRRLPKRGFKNIFRKEYLTVNIDRLNDFEAGSVIGPDALHEKGLIKKGTLDLKVLGNGDIKVALTVQAHKFTKAAAEKIVAAGGTADVLVKPDRKYVRRSNKKGD